MVNTNTIDKYFVGCRNKAGSKKSKFRLYKGKEIMKRGISSDTAVDELISLRDTSQRNAESVEVVEPTEYFNESEYDSIKSQMNDLDTQKRIVDFEKTKIEKLITQLEEGTVCPSCNRPLEGVDHSQEIDKLNQKIEEYNGEIDSIIYGKSLG